MKYGRWQIERIYTKMNGYMQWIWVGDYISPNSNRKNMMLDHCFAFSLKDLMQLIKSINKAKN